MVTHKLEHGPQDTSNRSTGWIARAGTAAVVAAAAMLGRSSPAEAGSCPSGLYKCGCCCLAKPNTSWGSCGSGYTYKSWGCCGGGYFLHLWRMHQGLILLVRPV